MKSLALLAAVLVSLASSLEAHADPLPDPRGTASEWLPAELYGRSGRLRLRVRAIEGVERPPQYRSHQESERAMWGTGVGLLSAGIFVSYLGAGFGYAFSGTDPCHEELLCQRRPKIDSYLAGFV